MKGRPILSSTVAAVGLVAALLFVLGGAAMAGPNVPPVLIGQSPAPNAFDAPLDAAVSATYDQDMDPMTVDYQSFAVHAMFTGWLTEAFAVQSGTIILTPAVPFHPGEFVQVSATTETLSLMSEGPITPTVWQFWTGVTAGDGHFTDSGQGLGNDDSRGLGLGDLDGDGDIDALVGDYAGDGQVYFNDGAGHFTVTNQLLPAAIAIALGDLDGDGDLDAMVGGRHVWLNDGSGIFTDTGQILGSEFAYYTALGDLDGDGDLDAFLPREGGGGTGAPNAVFFNDGNGTFTDSGQALGNEPSTCAALGDLDGDGDLDAFVADGWDPLPNRVWINDGHGVFNDSGQLLGNGYSLSVALGDLNGDGYLDAFVSNIDVGEADEVWINDGSGTFTQTQSLGNYESAFVSLSDVDADGDLDAVVAGLDATRIWLNDGAGVFTESAQQLPDAAVPGLGDLNSDGSLDILLARSDFGPQPNQVWFNAWYRLFLPVVYTPLP